MSLNKKPKLNLHTKSLILRHHIEWVFKQELSTSEFFKQLLISKQFLHSSQFYKIYKLTLYKAEGNRLKLCLTSFNSRNDSSKNFEMTYDNLKRMNELLRVHWFGVNLFQQTYQAILNACPNLFGVFEGKIALITQDLENPFVFTLITQLAQRLFQVQCKAFLLAHDEMPQLTLDVCTTSQLDSLEQLKKILLKHHVRNLDLACCGHYFKDSITDNSYDEFPLFPRIQTLKLFYVVEENDDFLEKVGPLLKSFPCLQHFECKFQFRNERNFRSRQLVTAIMMMYVNSQLLQMSYGNSKELRLDFIGCFYIECSDPQTITTETFDELKKKDTFVGTKMDEYRFGSYTAYFLKSKVRHKNLLFDLDVRVQAPSNH